MRKTSKLSEVAKIAGVSPITASRAIRGVGYVSESARARIMEAAAQLNYTPDMLARRMRGDKSNLIGVFVNNYGSLVLHEVTRAISTEARARGYDILLFNAERFDSPARAGTVDMLSKLCDGLLLVMPNGADGYLDVLEQHRMPCVLVHYDARPVNLPVMALENRNGARMAVEHLLALGHRRIAFLAGTSATGQSAEREKGYKDALRAAGIRADASLIVGGAFNQAAGHAAAQQLLALNRPPTAIFAANDEMAYGAIDAIHSRGMKVPGDISVIGFDDIPLSSHVFPPLTTMRQPLAELAARAVGDVVTMAQGGTVPPERVPFAMELVIRQSTGPAATAGAGQAADSAEPADGNV
ncbi:LacI family DNA-binding transcriptional regulator [Pseudoduganella umbonata]|uniref:LacI family transcriptional regulator n=1 Tax=Pseudoduganella umbonata TaxID=864828 RepID=A0A4V1EDD9_9BURK|nr:LacI family DNA-binding transcriptional regulator [Pseudoduganella umbonata]MBB3222766.1 LacI family transcriptional regulator [Pseudoduganella umbonata]QCP10741.1 LacI family transcriptional regulator [Pseudoduganella umbonata]